MGTFGNEKNLGKRLLNLKEDLEAKKAERQELQGELKSLIKQLKELGIDTLEEAEKELKSNEKALVEMENSIKTEIQNLEDLVNDY